MRLSIFVILFIFTVLSSSGQSIVLVDPDTAEQGDELLVTVFGENTTWAQATNVLILKQNNTEIYGSPQTVVSNTEINGYFYFTSNHPTGSYDVRVENWSNGTEVVLEDGFTLYEGNEPSITSVDPDTAHQVEAVTVTITGENTQFQQGSSVLKFSNGNVSIFPINQTIISDTVIEGDFLFNPDQPVDDYDVIVYSYDGSVVEEDGFHLLPALVFPELTDVDPESAEQDEIVTLIITGQDTHFDNDDVTNSVMLHNGNNTIFSQSVSVTSATSLEATFAFTYYQNTGVYDVLVQNELDGLMNLEDAFTLDAGPYPPEITSVDPDTATQVLELLVTITGTNTHFGQSSSTIVLYGDEDVIYAQSQTVFNDTLIEGNFFFNPDHAPGDYDVTVHSVIGSVSLEDGFHLLAVENLPELLSIVPDTASQGESVTAVITGQHTHFNWSGIETDVKLESDYETIYASSIVAIDSVKLEVGFTFYSYHDPGVYDLRVYNILDGTMLLEDVFTLNPGEGEPQIISVDPDHADQEQSLWVTITGNNTSFTTGSATIVFVQGSSTIHTEQHYIESDTKIEGDFDFKLSDPVGFYDVYVYDVEGSWSVNKMDGFYLYPPISVEENEEVSIGSIYPNPATELLFIKRNPKNSKGIAIDVMSVSGELVYMDEMAGNAMLRSIDVSNFESGIYLVKLRCENEVRIEKVVIR